LVLFEKELKNNIIGHDNIIDELLKNYKKIKLGFKDDNMCYSILFIGPSGVGKTNLAKLFSKKISNNIIKLDMSEYSEAHSISKLIGAPAGYVGYNDNKNLLDKIKDNPFSVIILDELEKAHPTVINLFYQILDEGKLRDSSGEYIYFDNSIIIMTSNVGFEGNNIGFNSSNKTNLKLKEYFNVSFINRIDSVFEFNYLSNENIKEIVKFKLNKLKTKYKRKNIRVKIKNEIIDEIIKLSNYSEFGARKIDKIIKNEIENIIINNILNNEKEIYITKIEKEKVIN